MPEMGPIFGTRTEELKESMSTLTRVFDGQGLTLDAGSNGQRGYSGPHMFSLLAATTPLKDSTWRIIGKLGNRLSMFDASDLGSSPLDSSALVSGSTYKERLEETGKEVRALVDHITTLPKETWSRSSDPKEVLDSIWGCAELGGKLRGVIESVRVEDGSYKMGSVQTEDPIRFATLLYNLARGRALIYGRKQIDMSDLRSCPNGGSI